MTPRARGAVSQYPDFWLTDQNGGCVAPCRGRDPSAERAAKCKNNIRALSVSRVCVNIDFHRQVSVKLIKETVLLER